MGWTGVDLFFVLSGFLISGLLFKEYLRFGDIRPKRFLVRRGFKIYPVYFIFYIPYLVLIIADGRFAMFPFLADMIFMQNYVNGIGYAYPASWSLSVEEHFYIGFSLLLWWALVRRRINLTKDKDGQNGNKIFEISVLSVLLFCLLLRIFHNIVFPQQTSRNFTMTHLRTDSLMAGVLIGYLYHFRTEWLTRIWHSYKPILLIIALAGLAWTPFTEPVISFFALTAGFTLVYISFGIILLYFLLTAGINQQLNKLFSAPVVNMISKIGYCSYSIYIIHSFVITIYLRTVLNRHLYHNRFLDFIIPSVLSVLLGMLITYTVEHYFLRIRDKYYPGRTESVHT